MTFTAAAKRAPNSLEPEVDVNGRHLIATDEPALDVEYDAESEPRRLLFEGEPTLERASQGPRGLLA